MSTHLRESTSLRQPGAAQIALETLRAAPGIPFRAVDIEDASPAAVARALSRLTRQGVIERLRRGIYFIPKETLLGKSTPPTVAVIQKALPHRTRPAGITAANLLGMTTRMPATTDFVVCASARPRGLNEARILLRRNRHFRELDSRDGALLEFLRDRGRFGELSSEEMCARAQTLLRDHAIRWALGSRYKRAPGHRRFSATLRATEQQATWNWRWPTWIDYGACVTPPLRNRHGSAPFWAP